MPEAAQLTSVFASVPSDLMVLGGAAVVLALISLYAGSSQIVAIAVASLVTAFMYPQLAQTALLSSLSGGSGILAVCAVLFVLQIVFFRWMVNDLFSITSPLQGIMAGVGGTIILASVWMFIPDLSALWSFTESTRMIFSDAYRVWWILGAFVLLGFSRF